MKVPGWDLTCLSWKYISQKFFHQLSKYKIKDKKCEKPKVMSTRRTIHGSVHRITFAVIRFGKLMQKSVIPVVLRPHYLTFYISSDLLEWSEACVWGNENFSSFCKHKNWILLEWAGKGLVLKHVHNLFSSRSFLAVGESKANLFIPTIAQYFPTLLQCSENNVSRRYTS